MNHRYTSAIVIALLLSFAVIPCLVAPADALSDEDFMISIPGGMNAPEKPIELAMKNGSDATFSIYIVNSSDKYLDISYTVLGNSEDVYISKYPENTLLGPENSDYQHISVGTVTVSTVVYSESYDLKTLTLAISVTDISDKTSTIVKNVTFNISVDSMYSTDDKYNKFLGVFDNTLSPPLDSAFVPMVVTILFWTLVATIICLLVIPPVFKHFGNKFPEKDLTKTERSITSLVAIIVFIISINEGTEILGMDPQVVYNINAFSVIIYVVLMSILLWKLYMFIVRSLLMKLETVEDATMDTTLIPLFSMVGKIVFWVGGASTVLGVLGVNLQGILISAGVISLGITLGAQSVLSQFFSGLTLLANRPFSKGDFILLNGETYIVRRVRLMFTEFDGWDHDRIITVPNNILTSATITNLSKEDPAYRLYVYFSVAYDTDLKFAEKVMLDAVRGNRFIVVDRRHSAPNVRLTGFEDSGITMRLGCYVTNYDSSPAAASELRTIVYQAFLDNDIEIPYNRLEITMLGECNGRKRDDDPVSD